MCISASATAPRCTKFPAQRPTSPPPHPAQLTFVPAQRPTAPPPAQLTFVQRMASNGVAGSCDAPCLRRATPLATAAAATASATDSATRRLNTLGMM